MNQQTKHQQHREWLSQLNFYGDEIKIFQNELLEVVQSHPDFFRMIEHVDEYRAILLRKLEHIDDLRYRIILHERKLASAEQDTNEEDHEAVKQQMETFVKEFEEMKVNFRRFVSRNN